jgi:hypothetical protein
VANEVADVASHNAADAVRLVAISAVRELVEIHLLAMWFDGASVRAAQYRQHLSCDPVKWAVSMPTGLPSRVHAALIKEANTPSRRPYLAWRHRHRRAREPGEGGT